jgi:hypothetical protein
LLASPRVIDSYGAILNIEYTPVDIGASVSNLDPFVSANYAALSAGSELTNGIVRPAIPEALSKLKVQTGSNQCCFSSRRTASWSLVCRCWSLTAWTPIPCSGASRRLTLCSCSAREHGRAVPRRLQRRDRHPRRVPSGLGVLESGWRCSRLRPDFYHFGGSKVPATP